MQNDKDGTGDSQPEPKRLTSPTKAESAMVVMPHGWKAKITAKKRSNDGEPVLLVKVYHPALPECTAFMEFPVSKLVGGINIDLSDMMAAAFGL